MLHVKRLLYNDVIPQLCSCGFLLFPGFMWGNKKSTVRTVDFFMEATPRFELGVKVLQTSALPLGYVATG
jgi:hypothetical protein